MSSGTEGASKSAQPTTPATHSSASCDIQHEVSLGDGLGRLDDDRRIDIGGRKQRAEIRRAEVAVDRADRRRQPAVIAARHAPEMLMRVDARRHRTTFPSAPMTPFVRMMLP
jgi:hypothetical protein